MLTSRTAFLYSTLLCLLATEIVECFNFWNAAEYSVEFPNLLEIDSERGVLIVAAKNSICHLSLDLQDQFNVQMVGPNDGTRDQCINFYFNPPDDCENYPHILTLPQSSGSITSGNGTVYSLHDTVLMCGSNVFDPMCSYRHRLTLEYLRNTDGNNFCPYKHHTGVASMWSSAGQLVSATPLDQQEQQFGITVSESPFNGQVAVQTLPRNRNWFYNFPTFVSMHEIGDYFYVFFREEALESTQSAIYSRVARVCKNDTGSSNLAEDIDKNIFTTFVKARISCSSGTGTSSDMKFHYNEIQDTFFFPNNSPEGSQEQLYAVFTSASNGPTGSAVCVFTFGENTNDIGNVFEGDYLQLVSNQWETVNNYQPFTCEPGSRSLDHARDIQLMKPTVESSNGPHPLQVSEEYTFDKIVVTQTTALDQQQYNVVFITAHSEENLVVIKGSMSQDQQYHVISTEKLGPRTRVSQMKLSPEGSVYIATDSGVYGLQVADCSIYTDCCSCVSARDPFCAFDTSSQECVRVTNGDISSLAQNMSTGSSDHCPSACTEEPTGEPATKVATTNNDCMKLTTLPSTAENTVSFAPPSSGGLNNGRNATRLDHTWTIVGAVVGFAGGTFFGIIVAAFFFRKSNIFYHAKRQRRRRRRDLEEHGNEQKSLSNGVRTGHNNLKLHVTSSNGKQGKNNNICLNDYTPVPPHKADHDAKLSSTYPPLCCDVPHSCSITPVPVSPPTTPFNKTFTFDTKAPPSPPEYSKHGPQVKTDPNVKASVRTEEHISNQQRAAYGRNFLARTPSIDASKHAKYSRTTLPVVSPQLRFGTQPMKSVDIPDAVTGWSQC